MIDEFYDRQYQAHREALNDSILGVFRRFGAAAGNAFEVLNRIEYSSPWATTSRRAKCN
jgi:hypothetical protein